MPAMIQNRNDWKQFSKSQLNSPFLLEDDYERQFKEWRNRRKRMREKWHSRFISSICRSDENKTITVPLWTVLSFRMIQKSCPRWRDEEQLAQYERRLTQDHHQRFLLFSVI
jgi:hypothetical protein